MAKKTRKKVAAKAKTKKTLKSAAKRKGAVAKPRRKAAPAKKAKPIARKAKPATNKPIVAREAAPPQPSFVQRVGKKIEGAVEAVIDTFTDAERLHRKLDPGISPEPE